MICQFTFAIVFPVRVFRHRFLLVNRTLSSTHNRHVSPYQNYLGTLLIWLIKHFGLCLYNKYTTDNRNTHSVLWLFMDLQKNQCLVHWQVAIAVFWTDHEVTLLLLPPINWQSKTIEYRHAQNYHSWCFSRIWHIF